ncbi:bcl-2-related ovarian killer protein-like [Belonocnema kinseyi]|uniref:bcl-2-related ovarian killer protein-like n=1 Tax=Belonocnema kinseyi TaxID=2817044 RepID=UPI00143D8E4F|nr:bcl-2-related ovarian killer protein-like [Belonocnema kinseyi]
MESDFEFEIDVNEVESFEVVDYFYEYHANVRIGSSLCAQYIRNRLKRSGIFHRKLGLKRMRSSTLLPDLAVVSEVSPVLIAIGTELEKVNPNLYVRIGRQTGCGSFSDQTVAVTMTHVSREIIRHGEITWSKIISIYAVAGGIAVDCVRQGKPEYLLVIQKALASVLEQDLAIWIQTNGGWSALVSRYRSSTKTPEWNTKKLALFVAVITPIVFILAIVIRL